MIVVTNAQDEALKRHLEWCAQVIEANEAAITMMEEDRMHTSTNRIDTTAASIAELKHQNDTLRRLLKDFEPAKFQSQVRA